MVPILAASANFPTVDQHYLTAARQMQALSLPVHIPLVCFGISFPAMVLFTEWASGACNTGREQDAGVVDHD